LSNQIWQQPEIENAPKKPQQNPSDFTFNAGLLSIIKTLDFIMFR